MKKISCRKIQGKGIYQELSEDFPGVNVTNKDTL